MGDFRANSADFERSPPSAAGLALPGLAPAGATGLDQGAVGSVGEQPSRQVLRAHTCWPEAARSRAGILAKAHDRCRANSRDHIGNSMLNDLLFRLRSLFLRKQVEEEMSEELRF